MKKKIVITAGEMAGISSLIILKAFENQEIRNIDPTVYGDKKLIKSLQKKLITEGKIKYREIKIHDPLKANFEIDILGKPDKNTGYAAGFYFEKAIKDALNKKIDAIVTAPLDKDNLQRGGYNFTGHTTMLRRLTNAKDAVMMLYGKKLKIALLTIHDPLHEVSEKINKETIKNKIRTINYELESKFKINLPKIALLGLNPHAGENGKLGKEELLHYLPAITELRKEGINIEGPFPADTYFYKLYKNYDVTVASYHDQGLIPLKMLHFEDGVNITLGIPIIRTSVDHGTAYDKVSEFEEVSEKSLIAAIKEAYEISLRTLQF